MSPVFSVIAGGALVLLGGFFGGALRYGVSGIIARSVGEVFPWGTLLVNITGAFAAGLCAGAAAAIGGIFDTPTFKDFVLVGLLGGYTTVSSLSLQTLTLALDGEALRAALNILLSVGLGVLAVGLGFLAAWQALA